MRALQIASYASPLQAVDLPEPALGPGDVLVRVEAAGICRSDVHYRSGMRPVPTLPLVPGHEIAGSVAAVGDGAVHLEIGTRVCLHYLVTCGECAYCRRGAEQFCLDGEMLGLDRQGGYAEQIVVPADNAHLIPDGVSTTAAAIMMCSTATALHALRRGRLDRGETVAIIGAGGLGMSAIQLANVLGAGTIFAVDIDPDRLRVAAELGAVAVDGGDDPVGHIRSASGGGVDVAIEMVGSASLMRPAVAVLAPLGRAVAVGITGEEFGLDPYRDLIKREAEILGAADHLAAEVDEVLGYAAAGVIDVDRLVTRRIPLTAEGANEALEGFGPGVRTVIEPQGH